MAYIGKGLVGVLSQSKAVDTMTGDGSDTTLTLSRTPGSVNNVEVYMDGVFQTPGVEYTLSGNTVSFSTAPETGTEIIALIGNDSTIITPSNDSISGTKIAGAVVTDAKIGGMAANKLSGALPAVDGSALTNIPSSVTKSASDPATDSNPAGGVGTMWANTTSGEMYVLTDATTDENVWFNVGGGDGNVAPYAFQGSISGYESGGHTFGTKVDKFSFTSDSDSTTVASLTVSKKRATATPSATHGYTAGSFSPSGNVIEKMAYATDSDGTDVGDLVTARGRSSSQASSTNGYMSSGGSNPGHFAIMERYSFVSDGNAVDIGDVNSKREAPCGHSSTTHGYVSKGYGGSPATARDDRERFAFASDSTITTMNGLSLNTIDSGGSSSSSTHGYHVGGAVTNQIDKYSFASDANATDVGDLSTGKYLVGGTSSTTSGYGSGGYPNNGNIEKFSFSSNGNASNIGSLTSANYGGAGHQV